MATVCGMTSFCWQRNVLRLGAGAVYSAPPDPIALFKGPTSKGVAPLPCLFPPIPSPFPFPSGRGGERQWRGAGLEGPPFRVGIELIRHWVLLLCHTVSRITGKLISRFRWHSLLWLRVIIGRTDQLLAVIRSRTWSMHSGSLFQLPRHYRFGDFWRFISSSHTVISRFLRLAKWLMPTR